MSIFKEIVVCKFTGCNQVYNDPRFLPCGKRTCAAHIETMIVQGDEMSSDKNMIKCHFCQKIHYFPDDSENFPVDENIPLLLKMKHCNEHEAAKKSFNKLTQLLENLIKLDKEDFVIYFFERVEADILLAKEVLAQKLDTYYQTLLGRVHEQKIKCLQDLKTKNISDNEVEALKQTLVEHESTLTKRNLDFILRTLDGDQAKWKEIQFECDKLLGRVNSLGEELNERIIGDHMVHFEPSTSNNIETICCHLSIRKIPSNIIGNFKKENDLIKLCKLSDKQFKLLYRATRDGFAAADFHAKCDHQSRTLTIIKTTDGYIFGGYTAVAWESSGDPKVDPNAFLFTSVNSLSKPLLIPFKVGSTNTIYCNATYGPTFGSGHDIKIANSSNTTTDSYSNLGCSFDFNLFSPGTTQARSFLAGSYLFQTSEIEVFQLN